MTKWIPEIATLPEKKLAGVRVPMSVAADRTPQLWRSFMPRRKEITNNPHVVLFSVRVYNTPMLLDPFDASQLFDKWAALEIFDERSLPDGFERLILPAGEYAVFQYKGSSSDPRIFQYIFGQWLPNSPYMLDHRPQFELLGERYVNNSPDSEEEIWIPIARRSS